MKSAMPTVIEISSYLQRSNLPTFIVEGPDDVKYAILIENAVSGLNVMQAGGKEAVLELFEQRDRFSCPTIFLVDADNWVFTGRPDAYNHQSLIVTDGYSLENDMIRDCDLRSLLLDAENGRLDQWVNLAAPLLASSCHKPRPSRFKFPKSLNGAFDLAALTLSAEATNYMNDNEIDVNVRDEITSNPLKMFRGKTLFQFFSKILTTPGRHIIINVPSALAVSWTKDNGLIRNIINQAHDQLIFQKLQFQNTAAANG